MAAVAGALTLGDRQSLATLIMPVHYRMIVTFLVMASLLLVRPWGLFLEHVGLLNDKCLSDRYALRCGCDL